MEVFNMPITSSTFNGERIMRNRTLYLTVLLLTAVSIFEPVFAATKKTNGSEKPSKVYVPYEKLKDVFGSEDQGVFLPYKEFQRLWRAAQGKPSGAATIPYDYLLSTSRFKGKIEGELATMSLELTIDVPSEEWVRVPLGLGEVAVSKASFTEQPKNGKSQPLLKVEGGKYQLVTKGKGRYVLALDFVKQLETKPGLHKLDFHIPSAAITTLELLIPEENMKVDVQPMLAATTSQVEVEKKKATSLQAFLGSADKVVLSWKPRTQAATELEPVIISEQFGHINISEALINYDVKLNYTIRRGGVKSFEVEVPGHFRITDVSGTNLSRWDIAKIKRAGEDAQLIKVELFSAAKNSYKLTIKMERFLQENEAKVRLVPVVTRGVLRRSGLIGITHSGRRLVHLADLKNLARVDTGRLPRNIRKTKGVTAYRFISSDYGATISIKTTSPRISVTQQWLVHVDVDLLKLQGELQYNVERTGIFELSMNFPEPWKIDKIGPDSVVDDYQLKGTGQKRVLHVLLKSERSGKFTLNIEANASRVNAESDLDFRLPLADVKDLQLYNGQVVIYTAEQLRIEVEKLDQLQAIPTRKITRRREFAGRYPTRAFEFRAIDHDKPAGGKFKIFKRSSEVSAVVNRLMDIKPGSIEQEALIDYLVRYAPVDTFYLKMPKELADENIRISTSNMKERQKLDELPENQRIRRKKDE